MEKIQSLSGFTWMGYGELSEESTQTMKISVSYIRNHREGYSSSPDRVTLHGRVLASLLQVNQFMPSNTKTLVHFANSLDLSTTHSNIKNLEACVS